LAVNGVSNGFAAMTPAWSSAPSEIRWRAIAIHCPPSALQYAPITFP
jgi:hypothetical protein